MHLILTSALPRSPLGQQNLDFSSNPSVLERDEDASLRKGGLSREERGKKKKQDEGKEMVAPEILSIPGKRSQLLWALSHFLKI